VQVSGPPESSQSISVVLGDQSAFGKFGLNVIPNSLETFEEGVPVRGVVKPLLPMDLELVLDLWREVPESDAPRRVVQVSAPLCCYGKHGSCLCEGVRPGEAAAQR